MTLGILDDLCLSMRNVSKGCAARGLVEATTEQRFAFLSPVDSSQNQTFYDILKVLWTHVVSPILQALAVPVSTPVAC